LPEVPTLGARGGGWVVLQFVLLGAVLAIGLVAPGWPDGARWWLKGAAALLVAAGALVMTLAKRALGGSFTAFAKPPESGELVQDGPYAVVRHPIYSGGLLFAAGVSVALSPWALVATAALAVVWALKASVEERFLAARSPAYAGYRERTRFRLVPYVY
jgi:protein-S-isoprenylcysteine O-methyltransferase Ste14